MTLPGEEDEERERVVRQMLDCASAVCRAAEEYCVEVSREMSRSPSSCSSIVVFAVERLAANERSSPPPPKRQVRRRIPQHARALLKESYEKDAFPEPWVMESLAFRTGLQLKQVATWFANTRKRSPTASKKR